MLLNGEQVNIALLLHSLDCCCRKLWERLEISVLWNERCWHRLYHLLQLCKIFLSVVVVFTFVIIIRTVFRSAHNHSSGWLSSTGIKLVYLICLLLGDLGWSRILFGDVHLLLIGHLFLVILSFGSVV